MDRIPPPDVPQTGLYSYQQAGEEFDANSLVWSQALESSQALSIANQNYNRTIKSEDTGSVETLHRESV
jgi:hypothetical protein